MRRMFYITRFYKTVHKYAKIKVERNKFVTVISVYVSDVLFELILIVYALMAVDKIQWPHTEFMYYLP